MNQKNLWNMEVEIFSSSLSKFERRRDFAAKHHENARGREGVSMYESSALVTPIVEVVGVGTDSARLGDGVVPFESGSEQ